MKQRQEFIKFLHSLIEVLNEEKIALIQSDGDSIAEIVERKSKYISSLSDFKGLEIEDDKEVMKMIGEIDSLQELNLLLTKQALGFQDTLLESISKEIKDASKTYSSKGDYDSTNNIGLIDQSV